ncbi:MAG: tripartite tricarboxylate transporter substrate binding protein [Betaproteobacteria bacterium]|nr:tripartite tricarboxylate transporter substrate binding protein [Betaproteobacteria bacterium]
MKLVSKLVFLATCVGLAQLAALQAAAQSYPTKPIRVISPSGAGGPVDITCRAVSQALAEVVGQQIVVENRVGAAGLIGTELVAKSPPDGYTLLFGFSGPLAIVPNLNPNTPYDVQRDLVPISQVAAQSYVLLVHPSVPAKSVKELVALAKSRPGTMNFSSGGTGVGIHMAGELFNIAAGVKIVHVPYKGAAPAMTALMAGEVDMMFNTIAPALPHIRSGKLRALAVGGDKRAALFPDLPTFKESGYDFKTGGWYGVLAPKGVPQSVVTALQNGLIKALASPELKKLFEKLAIEIIVTSPQEFADLIRTESALWAKVIKAAGIQVK